MFLDIGLVLLLVPDEVHAQSLAFRSRVGRPSSRSHRTQHSAQAAAAEAGVEGLAEGVAEQVEAEDGDEDGQAGVDGEPGGGAEVLVAGLEAGAPAWGGGSDAQAEGAQRGLG